MRLHCLAGDLAETVSDDWWAETTLLFAATSNADRVVQACLNANSAPALALALDCTEQDSDVDPDLRRRVNDLVISAAGPDADQERRRLFAGILLSRHMRQRERTTTGVQVCARPIPADIYRLFLADTQTPEPDATLAESGTAVGMRSSDAAAFAQWAIAVSGRQQSYRLPLAAELNEVAARHRIPALPDGRSLCPWAQGDKASSRSLPMLWLPSGVSNPYELSNESLIDAGKLDAARSAFTLSGLLLRSHLQIRALDLAADRVLVRVLVRAVDRALDLDLDRVRVLTRDRVFDLALARKLARALASDLGLFGDRVRVRALASVLDLDRPHASTRAVDGDLDLDLDFDRVRVRALAVAIDETVNRYLLSRARHDPNQPILDTTLPFFPGTGIVGCNN